MIEVLQLKFYIQNVIMQGQAHTKPGGSGLSVDTSENKAADIYGASESPNIPGSPITYSPQLPMEPMYDGMNRSGGIQYGDYVMSSLEPKSVPTVIVWSHGGHHVELEGSFDNWTTRHVMQHSGKDFSLVKLLPPGVYQYKFIVDGQWRHDPNLTCMYDDQGNINNVLEVQEYIAENLDGLANFEPPPSPDTSYNCPVPASEDFMKEPPAMPPQLQLSLLNVPSSTPHANDGYNYLQSLPRPQHVILNHMYCQRVQSNSAIVIGSTHRYKSKYITVVLYRAKESLLQKVQVVRRDTHMDAD